ncbi:VG15 protein [Streptomyces anulatus]|uniref:VG15 protein n=1 Tax=Streptomyces anulatus TaxID=1892 RepID=UPI00364DB141
MSRQSDFNATAQAYHQAQVDISASLLERVASWWRGLSPQRAAEGSSAVVREFQALVSSSRSRSYAEGAKFHNAAREVATGEPAPESIWGDRDLSTEAGQSRTAFYVHTAPVRAEVKRGRLDDPEFLALLDDVMSSAGKNLADDAGRLAEMGGRDALADARENDPEVIGYYRKTDADPCGFCAMLAARGAAYTETRNASRSTRAFVSEEDPDQYHRNCHCQTLPLFRGVSMPPEDAAKRAEYLARWNATDGSGAEQLRNFQRDFNAER